jgi:hypothetical protein
MTLPSTIRLSPRAREFYSQVFQIKYARMQSAARQTPVVIMLWGPRYGSNDWSRKRIEIHDELRRLGHQVFFSEEVGVPTALMFKKGVEYLQSDTADVIVVLQSSYGVIGEVRHFVDFRVVNARMLLFVDETASDYRLYERALAEMKSLYDNAETYRYPEDLIGNDLIERIARKISVLQMVKHRAIQSAHSWALWHGERNDAARAGKTAQPFRHNLLELYREHREEIDVLTDEASLFILAWLNHAGDVTAANLPRDVAMEPTLLSQRLALLGRGGMILELNGLLTSSRNGKRLLDEYGLIAPPAAAPPPRPVVVKRDREIAVAAGVGVAFAALILMVMAFLYGANLVQNRLPLALTPASATSAPARTVPATPTLTTVATPTPR